MKTVSAKYARQNFSEILNEVHFGRKKILITRSGKPMVILVSTKEQEVKKKEN
ncbi:MAG: type II toxin-antitoxin system Phd/YefM family antitoxin [Candidatus Levybacteria bacterium]|nr:type II toxin-antitoxin system Phd/YefM family antitoxin [Candidatus Levybacteria bacterium]